jgi:formylglycine-generating enzyme required for sulfatase activity
LADAVGNVWEWVAQFFGGLQTSSPGAATAWGFEDDQAWNFLGQSYNPDAGGWTAGLPAMLVVGGVWYGGSNSGVRAAYADGSASDSGSIIGFRLAR